MRVLVVEDDDLVRAIAVDILAEEGFETIEATNGDEALDCCAEAAADVLFTDIRLPGRLSGWEIAERCRERNPTIPVIYATGFSGEEPRPVPGSLLLQKPYRPEQIIAALRRVVQA